MSLRGSSNSGAGLLLVVMVLLAIGLTASVMSISVRLTLDEKSTSETREKLRLLAEAISATNFNTGNLLSRHYEQDVGALPAALSELQSKPGAVAACSLSTTTRSLSGWCGPYWDPPAFTGQDVFSDGWNNTIILNTAGRHVRSRGPNLIDNTGGVDDLVQTF